MLRPRLIPCLLIHNGGLYKTVEFGHPKYVGDPINAVRIYNEKEVDELIVVDIDASKNGTAPNNKLIEAVATECRMPVCYGGGVKTVDDFVRIIGLGVEKVAVSSAAVNNPSLIDAAATTVGSQSVVVVIDVKKTGLFNQYEVVTINASKRTGYDPVDWAKKMQALGAGEIILNSVDNDGRMEGYDLHLVEAVRNAISTPLTILGGVGSLQDVQELYQRFGIIGAAAGSFFVFKGKYRAVLLSYPNVEEKRALYQ